MATAPARSSAFEAFADPTRREILLVLAVGEMTVGQVADHIQHVGRTSVSTHLRVLRLAGLVTERRQGRFRFYSVDPAPAPELVSFISTVYRAALADLRPQQHATDKCTNTRFVAK